MKCEACLNQLEEYIDGELVKRDAEQVSGHLMACVDCARTFDTLMAEQEVYARYDRELETPPSLWNAIEARIAEEDGAVVSSSRFNLGGWFSGLLASSNFGLTAAGAVAVLIAAIVIGLIYIRTQRESPRPEQIAAAHWPGIGKGIEPGVSPNDSTQFIPDKVSSEGANGGNEQRRFKPGNVKNEEPNVAASKSVIPRKPIAPGTDQNDVLFSETAYSDDQDIEAQKHIERAQILLRSIRNAEVSNDDVALDVAYEKALARRLLSENIVLRRDAETKGKFPVKTLLSDLEPFLIDIANLQDQATPAELLAIKDRVRKTEIVAVLQTY